MKNTGRALKAVALALTLALTVLLGTLASCGETDRRPLVSADVIRNVPSWHHQAVKSTEGTRLAVTGVTETSGVDMIEAVERPDKDFVLGVQFHPEIAVVRNLDDVSLLFFTAIVDAAK